MAGVVNRSVGMMDDAYFVGRKAILDWVNSLCQLKLPKIEETASGAVACQVMDALFPGKVPMAKVNWSAKTDYEFVANYKVLQSVFSKLKIDRAIEVDRLIRARYQDNLEFMQWLKKFFEDNYSSVVEEYDPVARREKGKGGSTYKYAANGSAPASTAPKPAPSRAPRGASTAKSTASKENQRAINKGTRDSGSAETLQKVETELKSANSRAGELEDQVNELHSNNSELKMQVEGLERERDFYFNKLREVEVLLQNYKGPDREVVRDILKVLYATEEDVDGEAALAAAEAAMAEADLEDHGNEEKGTEGDAGVEDA